MKFTIDDVTVSQNVWDRTNRWKRSEYRTLWYWLVKIAIGVNENPERLRKVVNIVRVGKRMIDDQNLSAGCKYLVDALQEYGHIWLDSPQWTRVNIDQRQCRTDEIPHMEIEVISLE